VNGGVGMKIKYDDYFNNGVSWQTRATVWCLFSDLVDNGDDTYGLVDVDVAKTLGFGSEIIVIDKAGMFLFWNGDDAAYDWNKYNVESYEPAEEDE
jgi:hypothetical protein